MKIVHIFQFYSMGGVAGVVEDLSKQLAKDGDDVTIISLFSAPIDADEIYIREICEKSNIKYICLADNYKPIRVLIRLRRYLKKNSVSATLLLHLKWGVLAGIIGSVGFKNTQRIEVYHSGYRNYNLQAFLSRPFIKKYIAVSDAAKGELIEWFGINKNKIFKIYNGVNIDEIYKSITPISKSTKYMETKFLSVGRLSYEKGFDISIKAFAEWQDETGFSCCYQMIGMGPDYDKCKSYAWNSNVLFTGKVPRQEVFQNIENCDVVIMPSLWEGNSIFLLEVLAIGKPIVITDIVSAREVLGFETLKDNERCRLFQYGVIIESNSVESAIEGYNLLYQNKESFEQMGNALRALVENFTIEKQAENYRKVISLK